MSITSKKRLIICNTYYQLIMALHICDVMFEYDNVTLILTDQTRGMEDVAFKLHEMKICQNVYYLKTKEICSKKNGLSNKIDDVYKMIKGDKKYQYICDEKYDELLYYNPDIFTHIIFAELYCQNKFIECSRYEEGILSYGNKFAIFSKLYWARKIREIIKNDNLEECTKKFYCCYPENYNGELDVIKVPVISQYSNVAKLLVALFDIDLHSEKYIEKYIFFTSVYDFEGENAIGEYEVVEKIAKVVGKHNILIKQHPRDNRNVYIDSGYRVDLNSSVPWEAIQLGYDFSDKILITVNSGSVLSANLMMENGPKAFFVFKFCDLSQNKQAQVTARLIVELLDNSKLQKELKNIHIAEKIEDIISIE